MERELYTQQSTSLGKSLNVLSFGHAGYPVVVFPTQGADCGQWEQFGMVDELEPLIEAGKLRLFCVDTVDTESWIDYEGDRETRTARQESYYHYICDELLPLVHTTCGNELRPLATGADLGATHAAIVALRRPDLFEGCIALSGVYRTSYYFGDWMNPTLYDNDITAFLSNMEKTHEYVSLYNQRQLVFCVGQGPWEEGVDDLRVLSEEFDRLGVNAWCDFWGFDVSHDWPWWKKQVAYFFPIELDQIAKSDTPSKSPRELLARNRASRDDECSVVVAAAAPSAGRGRSTRTSTRTAGSAGRSAGQPSRIAVTAASRKVKREGRGEAPGEARATA